MILDGDSTDISLLEIDKNPDCYAECDKRHGVADVVQRGRHLHPCLGGLAFQRHVDTRLVVRVIVPLAVAVAESAGILCEERKGHCKWWFDTV